MSATDSIPSGEVSDPQKLHYVVPTMSIQGTIMLEKVW